MLNWRNNDNINIIYTLVALYALAVFFSHHVPLFITNVAQVSIAIYYIVYVTFHIKGIPFKGIIGLVYVLLLIWSICITIHMFFSHVSALEGITLNMKLGRLFISPHFFPYLLPFMLLCIRKNSVIDFSSIRDKSIKFAKIFLLLSPLALYSMLFYKFDLSVNLGEGGYSEFVNKSTGGVLALLPAYVFVYFKIYQTSYEHKLFLICLFIALFMGLYMGRRGRSAMYLLYLVTSWLLYMKTKSFSYKLLNVSVGIFFAVLCCLFFYAYADSLFSVISERGLEDTRSGVEESFVNAMSLPDWIFGRGWFGEYYDPIFGTYRSEIETGFYALILKGGIIYLFLFICILFLSSMNGLFKSKNSFVKAYSVIILLSIVYLYPYGWPMFDFNYFMMWLGVYICNNRTYLHMTDAEIKQLYFTK